MVAGNYVVKVVYLPYPQFQDLATAGPDEVVSTRLEPGVDPIAEAVRRTEACGSAEDKAGGAPAGRFERAAATGA